MKSKIKTCYYASKDWRNRFSIHIEVLYKNKNRAYVMKSDIDNIDNDYVNDLFSMNADSNTYGPSIDARHEGVIKVDPVYWEMVISPDIVTRKMAWTMLKDIYEKSKNN